MSFSQLSLRLMSTLQLQSISVGELTFHLLPTKWCFLCVSARSLHVRLVTIKNEGSVLQGYTKAGFALYKWVFNRGSDECLLAGSVWNCYTSSEKTNDSCVLGHRNKCEGFGSLYHRGHWRTNPTFSFSSYRLFFVPSFSRRERQLEAIDSLVSFCLLCLQSHPVPFPARPFSKCSLPASTHFLSIESRSNQMYATEAII